MLGEQGSAVQVTRLDGGYTLQAFDGGRSLLGHECGKSVEIADVDNDPIRWHIGTHRCGPPGSTWHVGAAPATEADRLRAYGPSEVAGLMKYLALVVDATDPATFKEDDAFVAGQQAARSLETVLAAAERWRHARAVDS